jgi:hypothetical protein
MDLIAIYLTKDLKVSGRGLFKSTNVVLSGLENELQISFRLMGKPVEFRTS